MPTSHNNNNAGDPASIVAAALEREGVCPKKMGTFGYLSLVKGRPHLKSGLGVLLDHPFALAIAVIQSALVYVIAHDTAQLLADSPQFILFRDWFSIARTIVPDISFVYLGIMVALPIFMLLNVGWGVMAGIVCGRFRLAMLLTFMLGLIPLRLVAEVFMPRWWFYKGEVRADLSITARVFQFSFAYKLATGRSSKDLELDWAIALDRHLKSIMDAYSSYALLPVLWLIGIWILNWLLTSVFDFGFWNWYYASTIESARFLIGLYAPYLSLVGCIAAWIAFERACLGAMTFGYLAEASSQHPTHAPQARIKRLGSQLLIASMVAAFLFYCVSIYYQSIHRVPQPPSGIIEGETSSSADGVLRITASTSADHRKYLFVLRNTLAKSNNRLAILKVFVHPGESVDIRVPSGYYSYDYAHGTEWYGGKFLFGSDTAFVRMGGIYINAAPMNNNIYKHDDAGLIVKLSESELADALITYPHILDDKPTEVVLPSPGH